MKQNNVSIQLDKAAAKISRPLPDVQEALLRFKTGASADFEVQGEHMALKLFHEMSNRVPAYKDFLRKNKVNASLVKALADFKKVPSIDKDNYLRAYPLASLCWDGVLNDQWSVFFATSGSTGKPFYFPYEESQFLQYAYVAELYLRTNFSIHKRSTLYINGFAMGAWIGGVFTYQAIKTVAQDGGYKLMVVNPGIRADDIIRSVEELGPQFDQVIIGGYPPFVKDVLDVGASRGVEWKKYNLKFIFSAEGFTEGFRDYIAEIAHLKNPVRDTLNHYGLVDLGTVAHETPISIAIRRESLKDKKLRTDLFERTDMLPTFAQYVPELFYFETDAQSSLLCSAHSALPLVRYDTKDIGRVHSYKGIKDILMKNESSISSVAEKYDIQNTIMHLPFVSIFERKDFTVSLYGSNIYAENIRGALITGQNQQWCSGRFTMRTRHDVSHNPYLEVHVELKPGVKPVKDMNKKITAHLVSALKEHNSEYRNNHNTMPDRMIPHVHLWSHGDGNYFTSQGKQQWVMRDT